MDYLTIILIVWLVDQILNAFTQYVMKTHFMHACSNFYWTALIFDDSVSMSKYQKPEDITFWPQCSRNGYQ